MSFLKHFYNRSPDRVFKNHKSAFAFCLQAFCRYVIRLADSGSGRRTLSDQWLRYLEWLRDCSAVLKDEQPPTVVNALRRCFGEKVQIFCIESKTARLAHSRVITNENVNYVKTASPKQKFGEK